VPNRVFFEVQRRPQVRPVHFITVGTLGFRKGTDLLFRALDALVETLDFKLTVVTNPAEQFLAQARATVREALWRRIQFKHHLTPAEVAREMETPTMMLLPTRADTGPVAAKEAAVAGVPLVASAIGGVPDYVTPGKNGLTFAPGDLDGFSRAIREAIAHPELGQGRVDAPTLARVRRYLSPEAMAAGFYQAYLAVTGTAGDSSAR
jgi:glycogen synthase